MQKQTEGRTPKYKELKQKYHQEMEEHRQVEQMLPEILQKLKVKPLSSSQKPFLTQKNIAELSKISIQELQMETVHRQKFLKVCLIEPCFKKNAIMMLGEDHTKQNCILIGVLNYPFKGKHYDQTFPINTTLYLKEPYLTKATLGGDSMIRVDHPSDILLENDPEVVACFGAPSPFRKKEEKGIVEQQKIDLQKYRLEGVDMMNRKDYVDAYVHYSEILDKVHDKNYLWKFLLNKAIACLKLNLFLEYGYAIEDVLELEPENKKVIFHKIKFFILKAKFKEAEQLLEEKKKVLDQATLNEILKLMQVERSSRLNNIDWFRAFTLQEIGEYKCSDLEVKECPYGLGVFAKRNFKPGQIIIIERPMLSVQTLDPSKKSSAFLEYLNITNLKVCMERLYYLSEQFRRKCSNLSSSSRIKVESGLERRSYEYRESKHFQDLIRTNTFEVYNFNYFFSGSPAEPPAAIYEKSSLFNHSCECNCSRLHIGNTMVIYSIRQIRQGQELFISYNKQRDYHSRQKQLQAFGIDCSCLLCQEQLQEIQTGTEKPDPKSQQLKQYRWLQKLAGKKKKREQTKAKLSSCFELGEIAGMAVVGGDLEEAARMLRRGFPMSEKQSIQIIGSAVIKNKK